MWFNLKYKYPLHKVGKLLRDVTVGHVERPGLVWIIAPPTEDSNALLQKVLFKMIVWSVKSRNASKVEMMSLEKWASAEKPTVGTLVAVRFSEDGLIYRAKVGRE